MVARTVTTKNAQVIARIASFWPVRCMNSAAVNVTETCSEAKPATPWIFSLAHGSVSTSTLLRNNERCSSVTSVVARSQYIDGCANAGPRVGSA